MWLNIIDSITGKYGEYLFPDQSSLPKITYT